MKKVYYYIFYKIYKLLVLIDPSENRNAMSAAFGVTSIVLLHMGVLLGVLNLHYFKLNDNILYFIAFSVFLAVSIFHYFLFEWKNRYLEIIEFFEGESKTKSIIGGAALIIYLVTFITLQFI